MQAKRWSRHWRLFQCRTRGPDGAFYEPSKVYMKMLAYYQGVGTPNYVLVQDTQDIEVCVWGGVVLPCTHLWSNL